MKTIQRNNPISKVINNYIDKKSGKVTVARIEIQRRFFGLDWKDQKKILAAFLESNATDRNWAYSRVLDLWDASFEPQIMKLWETYHEEKCSWIIIRHFPIEYIKANVNTFNEGRDYYFICRRLADSPDFVIDKTRLSNTDYLMVLSHAGRQIADDEAIDILYSIVREVCFSRYADLELSRNTILLRNEILVISNFNKVSIALYYLKNMEKDSIVSAFGNYERTVRTIVKNCEDYKALVNKPQSDFSYKEDIASIVQKYAYYSLPSKYKTMTDKEYDCFMAFDSIKTDKSTIPCFDSVQF